MVNLNIHRLSDTYYFESDTIKIAYDNDYDPKINKNSNISSIYWQDINTFDKFEIDTERMTALPFRPSYNEINPITNNPV